jgi:acetyl esterase
MDDAALEQLSPLLHVDNRMPPTLLLDGTQDWLNPQIREFVRKCKSIGAPVETYYAEGQPHGFFNRAPWLQKTTAEVDQFLCSLGYLSEEPQEPLPTRSSRSDPEAGK